MAYHPGTYPNAKHLKALLKRVGLTGQSVRTDGWSGDGKRPIRDDGSFATADVLGLSAATAADVTAAGCSVAYWRNWGGRPVGRIRYPAQ